MIYLDHAATTPVDSRVLEAMQPYFVEKFGNPSSLYGLGRETRAAVDQARLTIAEIVNCQGHIVFTGGGS